MGKLGCRNRPVGLFPISNKNINICFNVGVNVGGSQVIYIYDPPLKISIYLLEHMYMCVFLGLE